MIKNLMTTTKFFLLYNNKQQEKLLTTASSEDKIKSETEYYNSGVWFSYESKLGSNLLENEKEMKDIEFPVEPRNRDQKNVGSEEKIKFKWVS